MKFPHDHGSTDTQDTQHASRPEARKAFTKRTGSHNSKGHDHQRDGQSQNRVPVGVGGIGNEEGDG